MRADIVPGAVLLLFNANPRADWVRSQSTQRSGRAVPVNSNICEAFKAPLGNHGCPTGWCLGRLRVRLAGLLAQEVQKFGVYFFRVRPRDAVWAVLHDQQARPFDELGRAQTSSRYGKDAVGISLNYQRRHLDASQVRTEVFVPGWDTRQASGGRGAGRRVPAGLDRLFAHTLP